MTTNTFKELNFNLSCNVGSLPSKYQKILTFSLLSMTIIILRSKRKYCVASITRNSKKTSCRTIKLKCDETPTLNAKITRTVAEFSVALPNLKRAYIFASEETYA